MLNRSFLFAGRATFVVANTATSESVTLKVSKAKRQTPGYPPSFFLRLRHQNDAWVYVGAVRSNGTIVTTPKSALASDSRPVKIAAWGLRTILSESPVPTGYRIEQTGKCGRCGPMLRDPESIALGLGPVCRGDA